MKRKLFFGLAALAALTITSCQKDLVINQIPEEQPIGFGTYVGRDAQTKASVVNLTDVKTSGFGVFAYYTGETAWENYSSKQTPNFMNNTKVTYNSTEWTYSPVKYWPNNKDHKVSFFAYAPYQDNLTTGNIKLNANEPKIDFIVPSNVTEHVDLLWNNTSHIDKIKNGTSSNVNIAEKVTFNFCHALSRIGFTLQAAVDQIAAGGTLDANTTITLNSITIGDNTTGFYTNGTLNLNATTASWSNKTGNQGFTLNNGNFISNSNIITSTSNAQVNLIDPDGDDYIMIIPQDYSSTGVNVVVNYTVETKNGVTVESTITNNITNTVKLNFQAGNWYTLNLVLGMTSVKVEATETDWTVIAGSNVDVPVNTSNPSI